MNTSSKAPAASFGRQPGTDRIAEIAEILAAGLMRATAPKSSTFSADVGEVSLHIPGSQSGDPLHIGAEKQK